MEPDDGLGFELVAASLKQDAADLSAFLPALATKLAGALPNQTTVQYKGGLLGKKSIQAIAVDLGETRFHIAEEHGRLLPTRQKAVRGIVLKNETLALETWIDELSRSVSDEARTSEAGRLALQRMLED